MRQPQQAIGILGGTFDPIHFGHLRTALELHEALDLAEVRLVPCYQPVLCKLPIASPEHRLAMVKAAVMSEPALKVDDLEIVRKGPSYMVDTLKILHNNQPHTPLCLILGIDAFLSFPCWHKWEEILTLSHLVIAHRPQYQLPHAGIVADLLKERLIHSATALHEALAGHILLHPVTSLDISSTDIRKQIEMDKNIRYLLPDNVYDYIKQHGTYSLSQL